MKVCHGATQTCAMSGNPSKMTRLWEMIGISTPENWDFRLWQLELPYLAIRPQKCRIHPCLKFGQMGDRKLVPNGRQKALPGDCACAKQCFTQSLWVSEWQCRLQKKENHNWQSGHPDLRTKWAGKSIRKHRELNREPAPTRNRYNNCSPHFPSNLSRTRSLQSIFWTYTIIHRNIKNLCLKKSRTVCAGIRFLQFGNVCLLMEYAQLPNWKA